MVVMTPVAALRTVVMAVCGGAGRNGGVMADGGVWRFVGGDGGVWKREDDGRWR